MREPIRNRDAELTIIRHVTTSIPAPRHSDTAYFTAVALLTIGTALVFGPVLTHDYIALDHESYAGNPEIQRGLSADGVRYAFTAEVASNWHPVTVLAHMALHTLFGPEPAPHYAANLVLHWANVLLAFELARRMLGSIWPAAFAAALFGLHPFRVESVAWAAELKDVLSAFFTLSAMLAYFRFAATRRASWYLAAVGLFVLGLLSKASVVALPVLLVLLDFWPLDRIRRGAVVRVAIEKLPFIAIAAAMAIVTLVTFSDTTLRSTGALPLTSRAAMVCIAYKDYVLTTFWPAHLSPHYPYPRNALSTTELALSAALLAAISAVTLAVRRRYPSLLFGWLWFVIAITPVCGILPVGSHYRADRYTYLAHAGFFIGGVAYLAAVVSGKVMRIAPVPLIAVLAFVAVVNVHRWRDNVSLFEYAVRQTPESNLVHSGLATGLIQQRRLDEAEPHLREAIRLYPGYQPYVKRLAALLLLTDRAAESVPLYESMVAQGPNDIANLIGLATAHEQSGRPDRAREIANRVLELSPGEPAAMEILERIEARHR